MITKKNTGEQREHKAWITIQIKAEREGERVPVCRSPNLLLWIHFITRSMCSKVAARCDIGRKCGWFGSDRACGTFGSGEIDLWSLCSPQFSSILYFYAGVNVRPSTDMEMQNAGEKKKWKESWNKTKKTSWIRVESKDGRTLAQIDSFEALPLIDFFFHFISIMDIQGRETQFLTLHWVDEKQLQGPLNVLLEKEIGGNIKSRVQFTIPDYDWKWWIRNLINARPSMLPPSVAAC